MKSLRKNIAAVLTTTMCVQSVWAGTVVSALGFGFEQSKTYRKINGQAMTALNVPYYFTVPLKAFSPIPQDISSARTSEVSNPVVLFNYRESRANRPEDNAIGLRLIAVNGDLDRSKNSNLLAESGIIKTGDILLSFRREWFQTLRYSHIQLGVSHAGVAHIEVGPDGKKYLYNLDMPMDAKTVGADMKSKLTSEHYQGAPLIHVLRLKGITDGERANIAKWIRKILNEKPYPAKLSFNTDYSKPNYTQGADLKFVGDLGRIALGLPADHIAMYCSEFAWSLLALRGCDPDTVKDSFASEQSPSCLQKTFEPMPILGNLLDRSPEEPAFVGMSDGPILMTRMMGVHGPAREWALRRVVFEKADGAPENISSNHRAVEQSILESNPKFYDYLKQYYMAADPLEIPEGGLDQAAAVRSQLRGVFNQSQKPNYSPTSFQVHAILPPEEEIKSMEYVGTLAYLTTQKVGGRQVNPYRALLETAKKLK